MTTVPATMKAVYIDGPGGPEVLQYGDRPVPNITPDQVLVKVSRSSINFIDVYHRTGLYKLQYPAVIGRDGAGVVVAVGENVSKYTIGQRVAFVFPAAGAYAEYCAVPQSKVVALADDIDFDQAVTMMLQGLTAHYLVCDTYPYKPGDSILIHAGAGGTGSLVIQIAKAKGLKVITTVSSEEKRSIVEKLGADLIINSQTEDIIAKVMEFTENKGVRYVLDGVGLATYQLSMKCVGKRGFVVFFGNASGPVPAIDPLSLTSHGSIFITRPTLVDYLQTSEELQDRFDDLTNMVKEKQLTFVNGPTFGLDEVQEAHRAIEDRSRVGKIIIKVSDDE
jgi:NADPH2:quinone reductase